jgi:ABC-type nitrate/sulfonate/bicarbonate transport system substrate-binding protein
MIDKERFAMKKLLSEILALTLAMLLPFAAMAEQVDIGYCLTDTTNPFIGWLASEVPALVEKEGLRITVRGRQLHHPAGAD